MQKSKDIKQKFKRRFRANSNEVLINNSRWISAEG